MATFQQVKPPFQSFSRFDTENNYPLHLIQQLDEIILSLQAGNPLSWSDKSFLQANADRVNKEFPAGIILVLRSIYSNTLPAGGIHQVYRSIQALKVSLSLHENESVRLENRKISGEDVENLMATNQIDIEGTIRVLQSQQEIAMLYEQNESRLQAINQIQEYLKSL